MAWFPIETAPTDITITAWHKVHKASIDGSIRTKISGYDYDEPCFLEKTGTTVWPLRAFSYWHYPDAPPVEEVKK